MKPKKGDILIANDDYYRRINARDIFYKHKMYIVLDNSDLGFYIEAETGKEWILYHELTLKNYFYTEKEYRKLKLDKINESG